MSDIIFIQADHYEESDLFLDLNQFWRNGMYEVYALYMMCALIQPMLRIMTLAFVQSAFYEGMGVKWYPRPGVDYETSCDEEQLLPWLSYKKRTLFTLPGRMKFATKALAFLEHSIRLSSAQSCVNSMMIYNFTTKTSNGGTTSSNGNSYVLDTWPEIRAGFIAVNLFNIAGIASLVLIRWELNRWIRWYKIKSSKECLAITSQYNLLDQDGDQIIDTDNGSSFPTETLLQRETSNELIEMSIRDDNVHRDKFSSRMQIFWYFAATGSVISWAVAASGTNIFYFHHATCPAPDGLFSYSRHDSIYGFLYNQLSYTFESIFFFQITNFLLIVIICFAIPTMTMFLCIAIEVGSRYEYLATVRLRKVVCALQYLRLCVGSESFLFALIFFYLEIGRISEKYKRVDVGEVQLYMTTQPEIVWGTVFLILWMVCLWVLNDLTLIKYKRYTLHTG